MESKKNYIRELNIYQRTNALRCVFTEARKLEFGNNSKFLIDCVCNEHQVTGDGKNKNSAKQDAARKMLVVLRHQQLRAAFDPHLNMDYSHHKNSTSALNELSQKSGLRISYVDKFYTECKFMDHVTSGCGITKRVSMHEASKKMLQKLGIHYYGNDVEISSSNPIEDTDNSAEALENSPIRYQINDEKLSLEKFIKELENKLKIMQKQKKFIQRVRKTDVKELREKIKRLEADLKERNQKLDVMEKVDVNFVSSFIEDFEQPYYLGHGGFAVVFKAMNKIDDICYAIKRIPLPRCEKAKQKMLKEVKTLAILENSSIVRYYRAWWEAPPKGWQLTSDKVRFLTSNKDIIPTWMGRTFWEPSEGNNRDNLSVLDNVSERIQSEIAYFGACCKQGSDCLKKPPLYLYIQMELCQETLRDWLKARDKVTPESIKIFVQIVGAVAFLHEKKIIHRDLKPGNIFMTSSRDIKVGDFGLATDAVRMLETSNDRRWTNKSIHTGGVGTDLYQAPEQAQNKYNEQVDIYALGIIFLELFYQMKTANERYEVISVLKDKGILPGALSEPKKRFIKLLMSRDPCDRPVAEEIQTTEEFKLLASEKYDSSPKTSRR